MEVPAITKSRRSSRSSSSSSSSSSPSKASSVHADTSASHEPLLSVMASSQQSESNDATQDANANIDHNNENTADTANDNNSSIQNDDINEQAPLVTGPRPIGPRPTAPAPTPIQHMHYESLPALHLNHPPFYGTIRDSTDGVPQYHPFSDEDDEDEEYEGGGAGESGGGDQFSRTQRVDHAYSDHRPDREGGQQRDEEESDSGGNGRRSRWERRRGAIMRMRTAMIWSIALPLLLVAVWLCVILFRKDKSTWETETR